MNSKEGLKMQRMLTKEDIEDLKTLVAEMMFLNFPTEMIIWCLKDTIEDMKMDQSGDLCL